MESYCIFLCNCLFFFFLKPKEEDSNSWPQGWIRPTGVFRVVFRMFTKLFIYNQLPLKIFRGKKKFQRVPESQT